MKLLHVKRQRKHFLIRCTGPRTPEGLERSRRARCKHGLYSAEAKAEARFFRQRIKRVEDLLERLK